MNAGVLSVHLDAFHNALQLASLTFRGTDLSVGEVKLPNTKSATGRNTSDVMKERFSKQFHVSNRQYG